jgi:hypothetical protein
VDNASLEAAGSKVYGSVLVKVRTPPPAVVAEEVVVGEVVLDESGVKETVGEFVVEVALLDNNPQLLRKVANSNIEAIDKYIIFFKIVLPFS